MHSTPRPSSLAAAILATVCREYTLSPDALRAPSHDPYTVEARHVAAYLLRTRAGWTLEQIAAVLGRHHTTVLHGLRKMHADPTLYDGMVADIARQLRGPPVWKRGPQLIR